MRIKLVIILAVVIIIITITITVSNKNNTKFVDPAKSSVVQSKDKQVNINPIDSMLEISSNNTDDKTAIPAVYDDDPVVDIQLIISNYRFCYRHLSNITQTKDYLEQIKMRVSEKQFDYYQNYTDYCESLKKEHPEYQLTNKQLLIEQNKENKATSQCGKIINDEIDVDTLSDFEIQSLLKQNDINILSLAPKYLDTYYQKIIHWDLEEVLQNHQYDYVTYIRHHSHQLYICNIGADCNPNSSIMARICYRNSLSCGLSFQEYINTILTHGQQADIKLALEYLQRQYN